ncbi:capsid protein [Blackfly DNA Virus 1]|nr:capsid protein [Blackfly DNA Virus 1]
MTRMDRYQNRQIRNIKKDLHQMKMQEEVKYKDLFLNVQSATPGGSIQLLNGTATGTDQTTRLGSQIKCTSLRFKVGLTSLSTLTSAAIFRIIVVWDTQTNGIQFTLAGNALTGNVALLDNRVITDLIYSPRQLENADRFAIVYDKIHVLNAGANNTGATTPFPVEKVINKTFKFNRITQYDAITDVIGAINRNSLHFIGLAQNSGESNYDIATRLYFKDI